jgi:hypothetical protein
LWLSHKPSAFVQIPTRIAEAIPAAVAVMGIAHIGLGADLIFIDDEAPTGSHIHMRWRRTVRPSRARRLMTA